MSLAALDSRRFLVFHPAWGYFARRYGWQQLAAEHDGKEPNARELGRLIEYAKAQGIRMVIVQPQNNSKMAQALAQAIGGKLVVADPLAEDYFSSLREFSQPPGHAVFLLPSLDPFVMGYSNRERFLSPEHKEKVFDRAGNALPTVWVGGRIVGAWGQRRDGVIVTGLFEQVGDEQLYAIAQETQRIQAFVGDEFIKPAFFHSRFTRALEAQ